MVCGHAASMRMPLLSLPLILAALATLPLALPVPSEVFEAAATATHSAPASDLFVTVDDFPRPEDEYQTGIQTQADTVTFADVADLLGEGKEGSLIGATSFALLVVPLVYVLYMAVADKGIVIVARPQSLPQPQAAAFISELVLVASIEHDIAYDLNVPKPEKAKVSAGGLGKVAGQLQRIHPTDLISVHPVYSSTSYGFEPGSSSQGVPEAKRKVWREDPVVNVTVDGVLQTIRVFRCTVKPEEGQEARTPQVTYLMLEHPWFRNRTGIYLDQPGSVATLRFFSLWNQAVGVLIAREDPKVYQCPDYHTALAPWYALRACGPSRPPPRVTVVLHNAEYQGAISSQQLRGAQVRRLAKILDLPQALVWNHMMIEGGFNMLQAGMEYVLITQRGYGVCAVSKTYAEESKVKHRVLWPLPEVVGLDNPMLENERPKNPRAPEPPPSLEERRRAAKEALYAHKDFRPPADDEEEQQGFGYLTNNPNARIFVFLGRWVKQKGMDYIADIAEWMVSTHTDLQLAIIGPPGDSFGTYCSLKLQILATDPRFMGRLKVLPKFYNINQVSDEVKFAFDFCFMPSRDEPFGYVDIEFGWFGALTVGAITGGLGKVPGVYFIPSNVNSAAHICHLFKGCVDQAMALSNTALLRIAEEATRYSFPVETWQADLLALYEKACIAGNQTGSNTTYLRKWPAVFQLFSDTSRLVQRDPKAPRRGMRMAYGMGSLEASPVSFSIQQMEDQEGRGMFGRARALQSFSLRDGVPEEETMDLEEFIRKEVDDSAIQSAVEGLVKAEAMRTADCCCSCREPPAAQDILAVTQWQAMAEGEFTEGQHLSLGQPLCGACQCLTKYLTAWLAGDFFGLKRIDFFIALHYLTAPVLQAFCVAQLPNPDKNRWPMAAGVVILPFAIVFWTRLSMLLAPHRVMALAVILRIPLLFLSSLVLAFDKPLDSIMTRLILFAALNFLAGADQIFVFYNFMGAAIGDISKLALRMGTCNGILVVTNFFGQVAINSIGGKEMEIGGATALSYAGLVLDVLLALMYICAPAPYREFCLPEWDLKAMWQHRRTLKFLFANIVIGAVTDPSVSGAAVILWRTTKKPFATSKFLGGSPALVYTVLVPLILAAAVITWSYILYRSPNRSAFLVKAGAFLLVPPALLRCAVALFLENNDNYITLTDLLILVTLVLDMIRSTCNYIALLSVVGSRWRFVSFLTVALFWRQLLACLVRLTVTAFVDPSGDMNAYQFAIRWMPVLIFFSVLQWLFSLGGFFFFDRESSALLTVAKRKLAKENNRGLKEYLRSLETVEFLRPQQSQEP